MTTIRQSANNTIHHTTSSSHYNNNSHDDNLDMLLEDLQTSVSRPGSSLAMNGPVTTGYREVTRTVTNQGLNGPERSTEYHIEYINPANSTTVLAERPISPNLDILTDTSDLPPGSRKMASYKQVSTVQYKTLGGNPVQGQETNSSGDIRMRQNINELDSLLDDLHTAQKTGFSADSSTNLVKKSSGYDSSLIEPIQTSTPKGGHVSRSIERKVYQQEQKYGSVGRQSPARELKYDNSYRKEVSPLGQRKEVYKYESKTTRSTSGNAREISPPSPPPIRSSSAHSPSRQGHTFRSYNYTSSSDQDVPHTPTMHHRRSPSPTTHRSPSPGGRAVRSYNYSSNRTHEYTTDGGGYSHPNQPQPPYRSPSPTSRRTHNYNTNTTTTNQETHRGPIRSHSPSPGSRTIHSYNYSSSSTKESKQEVPRSPPPHRSPSPVSFVTPSSPVTKSTVKTYNFEQSPRPQSPQPMQKFSPSDPSRTLNYQVSPPPSQTNVYSYKYSTHTTSNSKYPPEEHVPLLPRPFPTPSPTPDQQQQPPKKLDELMASFGDTDIQQHHYNESHRYTHQQPQQQTPRQQQLSQQPVNTVDSYPPPATVTPSNANNVNKSKNVSGPPVYYPPGVELFSKKEETCVQQQSGGGGGKMKAKAKAKYEYESKSKSKEKSSTKKSVVPVCLPVCCAMPCVIM